MDQLSLDSESGARQQSMKLCGDVGLGRTYIILILQFCGILPTRWLFSGLEWVSFSLMLFQAGCCQTFQAYRHFLFIFTVFFIRCKLCCFISSLAVTLRFQHSFTFQSFVISEESSIITAFLANQGEIFSSYNGF